MQIKNRNWFDFLMRYLILGFVLNFFWEIIQSPLYAPHYNGIAGLILVHLRATGGDAAILLGIYFLGSGVFRNKYWVENWKLRHGMFFGLCGLVVAIGVEMMAIHAKRWAYGSGMPIIPGFEVGLMPIFQMVFIPLVILWILDFVRKKNITLV